MYRTGFFGYYFDFKMFKRYPKKAESQQNSTKHFEVVSKVWKTLPIA